MKIYLIISNSIQIQITSLDYEALFKFICLNKKALSIKKCVSISVSLTTCISGIKSKLVDLPISDLPK